MKYTILEQIGTEITHLDGAAINRMSSGLSDGIVPGVLNQCSVYQLSSNAFEISSGELIIQGIRIKITEPYTHTITPTIPMSHQCLVASISVSADGVVRFGIVQKDWDNLHLSKDPILKFGQGSYDLVLVDYFASERGVLSLTRRAKVLTSPNLSEEEFERIVGEVVDRTEENLSDIDKALDQIIQIQNELINGSLEYELGTSTNGDSYYIVRGIGTYRSSHLVIPDTHRGIVVSEIAENAFQGNLKLTSAVIGKNILTVGKCAFEGCSNLTSIQLTRERKVYDPGNGWTVEECYGQTDTAIYSRLASDSDPATVANLWTITQDEANTGSGLEGDIYTTDAWYWAILPW